MPQVGVRNHIAKIQKRLLSGTQSEHEPVAFWLGPPGKVGRVLCCCLGHGKPLFGTLQTWLVIAHQRLRY